MFHVYEGLCYAFAIVGAIAADSWFGHFKATIMIQLLYVVGAAIIAIGNVEPLNLSLL